ncbi:MAG TPA: FAD-dependent monooxygenase [Mycobacterium sp.]
MTEDDVGVLIAGAGVGGLTTSALLARHGVRSLLVEKRREIFVYPKARNLTFRSLEILRGLGVGPAVNAVADQFSSMVGKETLTSLEEKRSFDPEAIFPRAERLSPEPVGRYCPQSKLEPILLAETRRRGSVVRYDVELVSFTEDNAGVVATIRGLGTGESSVVRADYLVAADGTHSRIRAQLGITTSGFGPLPIFVVFVYFRAPWRRLVPNLRDGDAVQVTNPEVTGIFVSAEGDLGMFITTYFPDEGETIDQFTPQRCRELLLAAVGAEIDIEIVDVVPWQPYERVANQFRSGRVFLVGDSAHTMPPLKGGGANTAIESANNLAWKLAAVLNGTAGQDLLDTYHAERYPVGCFSARQSLTGPGISWLRLADTGPGLPADEERPLFYMIAGYRYRSTAVVAEQPASVSPDAVQLVEEEQLHGEPGTRVPHAWVLRGGERISTLDLLGTGFTLFTGSNAAGWRAAADSVSASLGVSIDVHGIGPDGPIRDIDAGWAALTGLSGNAALLIRPDGFVGWRADALPGAPAADLHRVLSRILSRL